jgi:hypothetical protein
MRAAVVYESWFGNTRLLAEAVAEVLDEEGEVELLSVDDSPPDLEAIDLLVVGAPTHVHGLSSATSRKGALERLGKEPADPLRVGVRDWLDGLPEVDGLRAAAFDTRADMPVFLVGSAARGIAKRLRLRNFELVVPAKSFFIRSTDGPLLDGELARARAWAHEVTARVVTQAPA